MSDPEWGDNILAEFNYHLRQAFDSSEEMDMYDVHSENPASLQKWQDLTRTYTADAKTLIEVVTRNPQELLRQLDAMLQFTLKIGEDQPK